MSQNLTINGEVLATSQEDALEIEQFLHDNYLSIS